jgi:menaquinone-dependent protoporphyrinogen oxidase
MGKRILVAYASKHGSTKEIAEAIGGAIREEGLDADVHTAKDVLNVRTYDAVILGAPVYATRLLGDIASLAKRFEEDLKEKPVFAFVSGMTVKERTPENVQKMEKTLHHVRDHVDIQGEIGVFGGRIDPGNVPVVGWFVKKKKDREIEDIRDWDRIRDWGRSVARELGKES